MLSAYKILLFFVSFLFICDTANSKNYYFSSIDGDDSRTSEQAQNKITPWKSLTRLNSYFSNLEPGDSVLLKRGDTFYGTLIINRAANLNPIVVSAYGDGEKPIISSLLKLTDWVKLDNGIYECQNSSLGSSVNVLLLNNVPQELGRYPNNDAENKGYLTYESHVNNASITDDELVSSPNFTGAEVVIKKQHWILERHPISLHLGKVINYDKGNSSYYPNAKYGYFIQNSLSTLDKFGEWYYNPISKKIYVYFGSELPSNNLIQISTLPNLVSFSGWVTNIVVENLKLQGANLNGVSLTSAQNFTLRNCDIEFSGENGINIPGVIPNIVIENCRISYSGNNGINVPDLSSDGIIRNNMISNSYSFPGMGKNGDGNGIGIYFFSSNNALIEKNYILNTGYSGIYFGGNSITIKNNVIDKFCLIKDDGAGIYSYTGSSNINFSNRKVVGNIIINGVGAKEGTADNINFANGIYIDDNSSGVAIEENSIGNISTYGIYLHNARNISMNHNNIYGVQTPLSMIHDTKGDALRNISSSGNILFSKFNNRFVSLILSRAFDIANFGTFENNYYVSPFDDESIVDTKYILPTGPVSQVYSINGLYTAFNQNKVFYETPVKIAPYKVNNLIGMNKVTNGNFDVNLSSVVNFSPTSTSSTILWVNKLTAGTLQMKTTAKSNISMLIGNVSAVKNYILKFTSLATKDFFVKVYLVQDASPFTILSEVKNVKIKATVTENEILFSFPKSSSKSVFLMEFDSQDLTVWLDNIQFYEADVTITNPDQYTLFPYNSSAVSQSFKLSGTYIDSRKKIYNGSINLKPYTSEPLILLSSTVSDIAITSNRNLLCTATPIVFTATATNGGVVPKYKWKINGIVVLVNTSNTFEPPNLKDSDVVTCELINTDISVDAIAFSNSITVTGSAKLPIITISTNTPVSCQGKMITFIASVTGEVLESTYAWKVNGMTAQANTNSNIYSSNVLSSNDIVTCTIIGKISSCLTDYEITSNEILVALNLNVTPIINIALEQSTICLGSKLNFVATTLDAGNEALFEWKINGDIVQSIINRNTFSTNALTNNDEVSCTIIGKTALCFNDFEVSSNLIKIKINKTIKPTISISSNIQVACSGNKVTFTASINDSLNIVKFFWKVNGEVFADNSNTSSYVTNSLKDNDLVTCTIIGDAIDCQSAYELTSNPVKMRINPNVTSSIIISKDLERIYSGSKITFTANAVNVTSNPVYSWRVNGISTGINSLNYSSSTLLDGDVVDCLLYLTNPCAKLGVVHSNSIKVHVIGEIIPPNAFSPNGDAINDQWVIRNINDYPNCIVNVFNREGVNIFKSVGYKVPWDGFYNGLACPHGVYFYVIELEVKKKLSGSLLVIK